MKTQKKPLTFALAKSNARIRGGTAQMISIFILYKFHNMSRIRRKHVFSIFYRNGSDQLRSNRTAYLVPLFVVK